MYVIPHHVKLYLSCIEVSLHEGKSTSQLSFMSQKGFMNGSTEVQNIWVYYGVFSIQKSLFIEHSVYYECKCIDIKS